MNDGSLMSKLIYGVLGAMLVIVYAMSHTTNDESYERWYEKISQHNIDLLESDRALLEIRAGFVADFDGLTDLSINLSAFRKDVEQTQERAKPSFNPFASDHSWVVGEMQYLLELDDRREVSIDQFKSVFSVLRNSRSIMFQLIREMKAIDSEADNEGWQADLNMLEYYILKNVEEPREELHLEILEKLEQASNSASSSANRKYLTYMKKHLIVFYKNRLLADSLLADDRSIVGQQMFEMGRLMRATKARAASAERDKLFLNTLLAVAALFLLFYGASHARKVYLYTALINDQNKNLELLVKERTSELESTLGSLRSETNEKQGIIENLNKKKEELSASEKLSRTITETAKDPIILADQCGTIKSFNTASCELFSCAREELEKMTLVDLLASESSLVAGAVGSEQLIEQLMDDAIGEMEVRAKHGDLLTLKVSASQVNLDSGERYIACIAHDLTQFKNLERELAQAQKLETVGQLAAGIAHEINTPAQYISNNLVFLQESVAEVFELMDNIVDVPRKAENNEEAAEVDGLLKDADIEFLKEEVSSALQQSSEGITHVSNIVRAMKDYSHPGETMEFSDINKALRSVAVVSSGEWKYWAEIKFELDEDLPKVECVQSDVSQVVLNIIVNAAHAIDERFNEEGEKQGRITISSKAVGKHAVIAIEDNGIGMSEETMLKVFDQFFTTKPVGKGTGQGLSIAHKLVREKYGGDIKLSSALGQGTTFSIRLPFTQKDVQKKDADPSGITLRTA